MGFLAPIIAAALSITSATAISALTFALNVIATIGLTFASTLLTPKPKKSAGGSGIKVTVRDPIAARRRVFGMTRVGGTLVYFTSTVNNKYLHMIIALAEGPVESIEKVYVNDTEVTFPAGGGNVTTGEYANLIFIQPKLGTPDQEAITSFVSGIFAYGTKEWSADHKLSGVAYMYVRLQWNDKKWVGGVPNVTAVVKGDKCYDPRSATTAWTDNPALIIRHLLTLPPAQGGVGAVASEIDDVNFAAQANICDELVTLAAGGTEKRYTASGILTLDEGSTPQEVMQSLLTACGGRLSFQGGKWRLFVAAWRAPTFDIIDGLLRGPIQVETRRSRRDQFNAIKGTFSSPADRYINRDYPAITSSTFEAEDGGTRIYRDYALEWTVSSSMAQRLAKIELYRSREPISVMLQCSLAAYEIAVADVVTVTHARFGWNAKTFEVTDVRWALDDSGAIGIDLTLRETSSTVYSWNATDEQLLEAAPATAYPAWNQVEPPNGLTITEELYESRGAAGVRNRVSVSFPTSPDAFVVGFDVGLKLTTDTDWISLPRVIAPPAIIDDVKAGIYKFRIRSVNQLGATSDWVEITQEIYGLAAPPASPENLKLQGAGGLGILTWSRSPDLDVRIGGKVMVKHSPALTGATWDAATSASDPLPGDSTLAVVPLQAGTYMVRFVDSSGVYSLSYASVSADQASINAFSTLATITEHSAFSGTKTNVVVASGALELDADEIDGTYLFASGANLGAVKNVRVTRTLSALAFNPYDTFDSDELFDSAEMFDGGDVDADAWVEMRTSQTSPSGSPTWSEWRRVDASETRAWGFQFRARLVAADTSANIQIDELGAKIEELA